MKKQLINMIQLKRSHIIIGVLALAAIIIFFTFFNNRSTGIDYKELIKAKDETIKVLQDQRPIFEKHIEELKVLISDYQKNDSLLITQIIANKQTIKQVDERLKNIPARIAAIANNNDSLRRAIADL